MCSNCQPDWEVFGVDNGFPLIRVSTPQEAKRIAEMNGPAYDYARRNIGW